MHNPPRRHTLAALAAAAWAAAAFAGRAGAATPQHYAVISLIGDEIELVYASMQTGGTVDRNIRKPMPDADGSFDKIALLAISQAIERGEPGARVSLLGLPPSALHRDPDRMFGGNALALPGSLVDAINNAQATRVVVLTKQRSETKIQLHSDTIGSGHLRGLGYYIDPHTKLVMRDSGVSDTGLLAPFAYVRLTLADARDGRILGQRKITATRVYPVAESAVAVDPWDVLAPEQKVERLRALLQTALAQETRLLLAGA